MRFIDRSAVSAPKLLQSDEAERLREEMRAYMDSAEGSKAQLRAPYDPSFAAQPEVDNALRVLFEGRCAYCESDVPARKTISVHLHRPPGFAADADGQTDMLHYVWLAYEWENMLLVCETCASMKSNYFPVKGPRARLNTPINLIADEDALLIDPCDRESISLPGEHFSFKPNGMVEGKSPQGAETIHIIGLNREALINVRREAVRTYIDYIENKAFSTVREERPEAIREAVILLDLGKHGNMHPEATKAAVLEFAVERDLSVWDLHTFADALVKMDDQALSTFLTQITAATLETPNLEPDFSFEEASLPDPTDFLSLSTASSKKPNRTVKLANLPFATAPIKHVQIDNFKALKSIEFDLPEAIEGPNQTPCMLILGENATGKSSVLEALALALLGTDEIEELDAMLDDEDISPDDMLHRPDPENWKTVSNTPLNVEIAYAGQSETTRLSGQPGAPSFEGDPHCAKIVLAYGPRRYFTKKAKRRFRAPAYRIRSLFDPMDTIANPIAWLNQVDQATFDIAARALREVLMLDRSAYFAREKGRIIIETGGGNTPLSQMSVGYKSVVAMACDIIREMMYHYDNIEYASAVVLIDEIETHLHPRWKMRIMNLLRRAFPRIQFIVTTHDPLCLKGMYDGEVFVLQRADEDASVQTLKDLPDPRGMRAEQILTSEFFGLGSTDPETDAKLLRYQTLMQKPTLSEDLAREAAYLRVDIEQNMAVGDSLQTQVVAKALKEATIDPVAPLSKMKNAGRKDMVRDLLAALRSEPKD
ncbi:MAG: AAA family ATPase [Paracoccaceae bacterium]